MVESSCTAITKENRLFIFLIKIKLGITYSSVSVLFNVYRTTVTRIFYSYYIKFKQNNSFFDQIRKLLNYFRNFAKVIQDNYPTAVALLITPR